MRETLAPWRTVDASVEWVVEMPTRPAALGEPKDLYVIVEADAGETTDGRHFPMASILFVNGRPTTHITAHAGHVAGRLAGMRVDDLSFAEPPRLIQDSVLGRVLGRAVAHEVGHFLSGSPARAGRPDARQPPHRPSDAAGSPDVPGRRAGHAGVRRRPQRAKGDRLPAF